MSNHHPTPAKDSPPWLRRVKPWLIALALLAALAGAARLKFIWAAGTQNGKLFLSLYPLTEERWDHPRLKLLRQREKLDQVVAAGKTEFEKIVLLRKWAHDQWQSAGSFYYPPWDAVEILDLARKRRNYGFCAQYAVVFLQACRSLGLHARYVDTGHFVTEVWSDDFNRWVIMDPSQDIHFERDGIPLGGRAMYRAYWAKNSKGIFKVKSDGSRSPITLEDAFDKFSIILRTNQLSKPGSIRINGRMAPLAHKDDYRTYPLLGRDDIGYADEFLAWHITQSKDLWPPERPVTEDADNISDPYNQVFILVAERDPQQGIVKLRLLDENAPDMQSFRVSVDDNEWQTTETPNHEVFLSVKPGLHKYAVRIKTLHGWLGPESWVKIYYYQTNWLRKVFNAPDIALVIQANEAEADRM
jgi:hypothetical protein